MEGYPSPGELATADWTPLVCRSPAKGDTRNLFEVSDGHRYTHVRLCIYPDGGRAAAGARRGRPGPAFPRRHPRPGRGRERRHDHRLLGHVLLLGGQPDRPGPGPDDGRGLGERPPAGRRQRLGVRPARAARPVRYAELDTSLFVGNAPGWAACPASAAPTSGPGRVPGPGADAGAGGWSELLPRTRLQPDTRHRFRLDAEQPVAAVRLDVYPDGGMARLRLWGEADPAAHQGRRGRWLDALPPVAGRRRAGRGRAPARPRGQHRRRFGPLGHAARRSPRRADPLNPAKRDTSLTCGASIRASPRAGSTATMAADSPRPARICTSYGAASRPKGADHTLRGDGDGGHVTRGRRHRLPQRVASPQCGRRSPRAFQLRTLRVCRRSRPPQGDPAHRRCNWPSRHPQSRSHTGPRLPLPRNIIGLTAVFVQPACLRILSLVLG